MDFGEGVAGPSSGPSSSSILNPNLERRSIASRPRVGSNMAEYRRFYQNMLIAAERINSDFDNFMDEFQRRNRNHIEAIRRLRLGEELVTLGDTSDIEETDDYVTLNNRYRCELMESAGLSQNDNPSDASTPKEEDDFDPLDLPVHTALRVINIIIENKADDNVMYLVDRNSPYRHLFTDSEIGDTEDKFNGLYEAWNLFIGILRNKKFFNTDRNNETLEHIMETKEKVEQLERRMLLEALQKEAKDSADKLRTMENMTLLQKSENSLPVNAEDKISSILSPGSKISRKIICEVCGFEQCYKYEKPTGSLSTVYCESCRAFMIRIMQNHEILGCLNKDGECVLPRTGSVNSNEERCQACYLKKCLEVFPLSNVDFYHMISFLPFLLSCSTIRPENTKSPIVKKRVTWTGIDNEGRAENVFTYEAYEEPDETIPVRKSERKQKRRALELMEEEGDQLAEDETSVEGSSDRNRMQGYNLRVNKKQKIGKKKN